MKKKFSWKGAAIGGGIGAIIGAIVVVIAGRKKK